VPADQPVRGSVHEEQLSEETVRGTATAEHGERIDPHGRHKVEADGEVLVDPYRIMVGQDRDGSSSCSAEGVHDPAKAAGFYPGIGVHEQVDAA